jgi:hypothetical protein
MDVEGAVAPSREQGCRQKQTVRGDDQRGGTRSEHARNGVIFQRLRLIDIELTGYGELLYRACRSLHAAARGSVRLRKYKGYLVACGEQARQRGLGKLRRAREY